MNVNILKHNLQSHQKAFVIFGNLIITFLLLSVITACSSGNELVPASKTTTAIPTQLQKLNADGGTLSAYVVIDGNEDNRINMIINREGAGTATVTIPNLSRSLHTILITYQYTNEKGVITLATAGRPANLSVGSISINIPADEYVLAPYDRDSDGVNNAKELLDGRDPFIAEVAMEISTATPRLSAAASAAGELHAFIILDGDITNRLEMDINTESGIAIYTFPALNKTLHDIVIIFEYTDTISTIILSSVNRSINLTDGAVTLNVNISNADFILFDEDNDGISNTNELLAGSNPRASILPVTPALVSISYEQTKAFTFNWIDAPDAIFYRIQERTDIGAGFSPIVNRISPGTQTYKHIVPLYARMNAQYILQSCNLAGCIDGETLQVDMPSFVNSIGYFKSDNDSGGFFGNSISLNGNGDTLATRSSAGLNDAAYIYVKKDNVWFKQTELNASFPGNDAFGQTVELSQDGNTLAVSAPRETSSGTGISITGSTDNSLENAGAVYVFVRNNEAWSEQAFIKASNTSIYDRFGTSISLSADGNVLAVGVPGEDSDSIGINGAQDNDNALGSGAVYVFIRSNSEWIQQAYIKSSNSESTDSFGQSVDLSGDGNTLVVGASGEDGINNISENEGAVYVFVSRIVNNESSWVQQQYLKPDVIDADDGFGKSMSLSFDGDTLVVTSNKEDSASKNDPNDNNQLNSGAVYVFTRDTGNWSQQAYLKAINSAEGDSLDSVSISDAGDFFVVGSERESSDAKGINGEVTNRDQLSVGAAYVFVLNDTQWSQQAHIKASNTKISTATGPALGDFFGTSVSVSGDKSIIAIGSREASSTTGINGDQNTTGDNNGAVYLY